MDPITININLNLPEKQAEWICSAIACFAQIIDQASRTAGTSFPPAQVNMTQHGDNGTQIAQVANVRKGKKAEPAAQTQQNSENAAKVQQDGEDGSDDEDKQAEPQHTHGDVRNLYIELTHQGKKAEASKVIRKYAAKVPEIPEDVLDAVYEELKNLEDDDGDDT